MQNKAHSLVILNSFSIKTKKFTSLFIFDLIGFDIVFFFLILLLINKKKSILNKICYITCIKNCYIFKNETNLLQ